MTASPVTSFVARNIDPAAANAIHDDDVARQLGFAGALVPGVELFARTASALVEQHGGDFLSGGWLALRFRRPVYDGETVQVEVDGALVLRGPDGEARAVGEARAAGEARTAGADGRNALPDVDPEAWPVRALPGLLPPPVPTSLPVGPLGTVVEPVSAARNAEYAQQVGDPLPLYREQGVVHPGLLLRAVNLVLMRNVDLGPWIHTASDVHLLAPAPADSTLEVRALVRATSVRSGRDEVRYDALVLADGAPVLLVDHTALFRL